MSNEITSFVTYKIYLLPHALLLESVHDHCLKIVCWRFKKKSPRLPTQLHIKDNVIQIVKNNKDPWNKQRSDMETSHEYYEMSHATRNDSPDRDQIETRNPHSQ